MNFGLIFEKVGDINSTYPYLCVYLEGKSNPFMEVGVKEDKTLAFTLYKNDESVSLSVDQWDEIVRRGRKFLPRAISDEEAST